MTAKEVLAAYERTGGVLKGHFLLTSGRHSDTYMQSAKLFVHPDEAEKIVAALADKLAPYKPDIVVSPAVGGIILGYELARQLGVTNIFAERENGNMTLRRVVDRSNGKVEFPVPYVPLLSMEVTSWEPDECPLCKAGAPAPYKPGSRK